MGTLLGGTGVGGLPAWKLYAQWWEDLNVHHAPVLAQPLTIHVTTDITLTPLCLNNPHL